MTDREIFRAELNKLREETGIGLCEYDAGEENGRMAVITALEKLLDSMPKEPTTSVWHEYPNEKPREGAKIAFWDGHRMSGMDYADCRHLNDWLRSKKWAYVDDLLKIDKILIEEPVSEERKLRSASEEYLKILSNTPYNNTPITNAQTIVRELITFLDNPSKYNPNLIEKPVSEDLTAEIKSWFKQWSENEMEWSHQDIWDTAEHFTNWQKQQMLQGAKQGVVKADYQVEMKDESWIDLDPCMQLKPALDVKPGDKITIMFIKEG